MELFKTCLNKNFEFSIKIIENKKNDIFVDWDKKSMEIHIGNPDCKNFANEIEGLIEKLQ